MKVRNAWLFFLAFLAIWIMIAAVEIQCAKAQVHIKPAPRIWHVWFQDPASHAVVFQAWVDDFVIPSRGDGPFKLYRDDRLVLQIDHMSRFYFQIDTADPNTVLKPQEGK